MFVPNRCEAPSWDFADCPLPPNASRLVATGHLAAGHHLPWAATAAGCRCHEEAQPSSAPTTSSPLSQGVVCPTSFTSTAHCLSDRPTCGSCECSEAPCCEESCSTPASPDCHPMSLTTASTYHGRWPFEHFIAASQSPCQLAAMPRPFANEQRNSLADNLGSLSLAFSF